uniref:HEX2 protein-like protein n=1 Tax=Pyricularia grisea TaxID=148305 RepID=Q5EN20_PYRGI|nr:HEX2 protein-like protein [Pyricularia grisea]
MAVVLQSDDNSYFQTGGLRKPHSQPKFGSQHSSAPFRQSTSASHIADSYSHHMKHSTSPTSVAIFSDSEDDTDFSLPNYASSTSVTTGYSSSELDDMEAPSSPRTGDTSSINDDDTTPTEDSSHPITPSEHADDDLTMSHRPKQHVDYLSHNWREEDIWESWKYVVARRQEYGNSARLENASWRTWMKAKNNLPTVSPESVNWLKDCDVTWLYGPLQMASSRSDPVEISRRQSERPKSTTTDKKPILKKRSMSEVMLQRSISTSSLVRQAAAAVQAQQKEGVLRPSARPRLERAATDYITLPLSSRNLSPGTAGSSHAASSSSSRLESPSGERKHIHFKEEVEQYIALDVRGDDDDNMCPVDDSDSENEALMMRRTKIKKKRPVLRRTGSSGAEKTIAPLPSTTLKYTGCEGEDDASSAMRHSYRSPTLTPSSSQETLRPTKRGGDEYEEGDETSCSKTKGKGKKSGGFSFASDSEDDESDDDMPTMGKGKGNTPSTGSGLKRTSSSSGLAKRTSSSTNLAAAASSMTESTSSTGGMRRTESGLSLISARPSVGDLLSRTSYNRHLFMAGTSPITTFRQQRGSQDTVNGNHVAQYVLSGSVADDGCGITRLSAPNNLQEIELGGHGDWP